MQEAEPLLELAGGPGPGQDRQTRRRNPRQQRRPHRLGVGVGQGRLLQHQGAQARPPARPHGLRRTVPGNDRLRRNLVAAVPLQVARAEGRRQEDAALGPLVIQVGCHQIGGVGQGLGRGEGGAAAAAQDKAARGAALGNPVGVGEGEQQPGGVDLAGGAGPEAKLPLPVLRLGPDPAAGRRVHGVAAGPPQRRQAQAQVGVGGGALAAADVALAEQSRQLAGQSAQGQGHRPQDHVRQAGVQSESRHLPAVGGDLPGRVQGAQLHQEVPGLGQSCGGRRVEPAQLIGVGHAPGGQFQGQGRQVGLEHLRRALPGEMPVVGLRPEAVAHPRLQTAGPAAPLVRRGQRHRHRLQAGHARARREARHPHQAAVDDHPDTLYGQARLGDGGGQHDPALPRRAGGQGQVLLRLRQVAIERHHPHRRRQVGQLRLYPPDLPGAGQEDQNVACLRRQGAPDGTHHRQLNPPRHRARQVPGLHRVAAPGAGDDRRVVQQRRHGLRRQGGGHDQEPQVGPQHGLRFQAEGETQVGVEAALVELVEDDQPDALQGGVGLEEAGEHPFGDHLKAGRRPHPGVEADPVAHRRPHRLAQGAGHVAGSGPGGEAAGLQHQDAAPGQPRLVQQSQGDPGRLAGPWRRHHHGAGPRPERLLQRRQDRLNGQRRRADHPTAPILRPPLPVTCRPAPTPAPPGGSAAR